MPVPSRPASLAALLVLVSAPLAFAHGHSDADVAVDIVSVGEPALGPWDPRSVTIDVVNVGTAPSQAGVLRLLSQSNGYHSSCSPIGETVVPALAPGAGVRYEGSWDPGAAVGTVTLRAWADLGLSERDYGNNDDEIQVVFVAELPWGIGRQGCGGVTFS